MAALPAGVQYGLSSESSYKEDKELVFLKLTDSAWKAIEDFIRNNRDKLAKPKIQFLPGNEGKISIPAPATNGSPGEATFHFSINSNAEMEGPQGSFECVRSDGAKRLESCGPLPRRMRVQANDDSYVATKDRMARSVAAEQSKCTRVIKPNQTDIGRRVKVRSSHPLFSSGPAATDRLERAERLDRPDNRPERMERSDNRPERMERPENRPERIERPDNRPERMDRPDNRPDRMERPDNRPERMTLDNRPERTDNRPERMDRPDNRPERMDTRPERIDRPDRPERQERPDRLDRSDRPERVDRTPVGNAPRPQPQPAPQQNSQQPHRPTPNPDLSRRSIKERLIQLLALKPFKKPELYARLSSEGIKEKDRSNVNKILPSIGSLKDNCYHLRRHMWNDVNEDWPFYTEEEKRLLKRRKPQNLTPPLSSDSANSLSPRASPSGNKRPGGPITPTGASGEELPSKKQRISHYRRPSPPSSGYATTSSGERHASDNEDDRTENITHPEPEPEPLEENLASEFALGPEENLAELEQIERQFPPITSSGTRRAYKNEFARLYTEYQSKYQRVADVAALFSGLKHQLKHSQPHSPHHQTIRQRILEEYTRVRNETGYLEERRRVHYLDRKLNHIKRMVHQYDQLRLKPERVTTASTTQAY